MSKETLFSNNGEEEAFQVPEGASESYKKLIEKLKNVKSDKDKDFKVSKIENENNKKIGEKEKVIITSIDINAYEARKDELKKKK
ncbi:MAG: hypothetical protein ACP5OX_02935, partial [Minisyncoccia bacterium]